MKNSILKIVMLCTFFLFSCEKPEAVIKPQIIPGVVLSFDDTSVNEWFEADKTLSQYSWKATFCVSKINS